ncbi:unnamed protein product [Dibothriocephalus latus]|uniref:Uncharacterized protein n=1 Tax=Dibothriocephalus latus TaxID=60516 RepID=A0A3P7LUQ3_DIBLA|nr:unnamed protein product [Dibothriocephalus latus]
MDSRKSLKAQTTPRPGYTTGILPPRTTSLPRPLVNGSADLISRGGEEDSQASKIGPSQRRVMAHAPQTRTLPTDTSRYGGTPSGGTSGALTDGYRNHSNVTQHRARSTTLSGGLPPPSISGLRPVSRSPGYLLPSEIGSRTMAVNGGGRSRFPRTASEGRRTATADFTPTSLSDVDSYGEMQFPTVQSWLRSPVPTREQKVSTVHPLVVAEFLSP